jgi:hypothetical protein
MWLPNDGSDAPKIPSGKGKRTCFVYFTIYTYLHQLFAMFSGRLQHLSEFKFKFPASTTHQLPLLKYKPQSTFTSFYMKDVPTKDARFARSAILETAKSLKRKTSYLNQPLSFEIQFVLYTFSMPYMDKVTNL